MWRSLALTWMTVVKSLSIITVPLAMSPPGDQPPLAGRLPKSCGPTPALPAGRAKELRSPSPAVRPFQTWEVPATPGVERPGVKVHYLGGGANSWDKLNVVNYPHLPVTINQLGRKARF